MQDSDLESGGGFGGGQYDYSQPAQQRISGPVTDPNDPRLGDPSYASDPEVLAFLNGIYGAGGTALNQPTPSSTWDPNKQAWNQDTTPPVPPPGDGGGGGSLGSLIQPFGGTFNAPGQVGLPSTPQFTPPGFTKPPAFQFDQFKGPDAQSVLNDPGYQFRLGQGEQALQQGAAAKGTLNGGATQKAILGYGQDYASNEFNNVWNRDLTAYNTNFASALGQYNTNYQTQYVDPYKFAYQGAQDAFAPQMTGYSTQAAWNQHENDTSYQNAWNKYLQDINNFRDQRDSTFNKQYQVSSS